ncbi:hypothetical protein GGG16DRAFT_90680 [Schizophyllum commune]
MLYDPSTAKQLKPWLVRTLEPICDAEPGALAEYILALLKHNGPESDLRKELTVQLEEFLEKECSRFIDSLFGVLRSKSYLPYDAHGPGDAGIPIPLDALAPSIPDGPNRNRRKRDLDDVDDRAHPPKGPRLSHEAARYRDRDAGGGAYDQRNGRGNWAGPSNQPMNGAGGPMGMNMNGGMGMNPMMQAQMQQGRVSYQPPDAARRGLCRDYHNHGYCSRGDMCKYSHGNEAFVPGMAMGFPMGAAGNGFMPMMLNAAGFPGDNAPYDPNDPALDMRVPTAPAALRNGGNNGRAPYLRREQPNQRILNSSGELPVIQDLTPQQKQMQQAAQQHVNGGGSMDESANDGRPKRGKRGSGATKKSANSAAEHTAALRPPRGSTKTLVVEKIPMEHLSVDAITTWFARFGTVTHVAIDPNSRRVGNGKALVSFAEVPEAQKAWKCEDAIFGNRFVRVFWHRPMEGHGQRGLQALEKSADQVARVNEMEDVKATPDEATKLQPAAAPAKKPTGAAAALAARQALLEKQIAEQKELMGKLTAPGTTTEEKKELMARLRTLGEEMKKPAATPDDDREKQERERLDKELELHHAGGDEMEGVKEGSGDGETAETLKAKLERLRSEAASLGINPDAPLSAPAPTYRGGFRGRGRGRGRGTFFRGGAPGSMKLDNRPKKLVLKGVGADGLEHAKNWYQSTGQLDTVETTDDGDVVVGFKSRAAAEQALAKGNDVPSLGHVTIVWHGTSAPTATQSSASAATSKGATPAPDQASQPAEQGEAGGHSYSPGPEASYSGGADWHDDVDEADMGM